MKTVGKILKKAYKQTCGHTPVNTANQSMRFVAAYEAYNTKTIQSSSDTLGQVTATVS